MTDTQITDLALAIVAEIKPKYEDVKILADGSVAALREEEHYRVIFLGCNKGTFKTAFYFKNCALATVRWNELQSRLIESKSSPVMPPMRMSTIRHAVSRAS